MTRHRLSALFCTEWSPSKLGNVSLNALEKSLNFFVQRRVGTLFSLPPPQAFPRLWGLRNTRELETSEKRERGKRGEGVGVMGTSIEPASPESDRERLGTRKRLS